MPKNNSGSTRDIPLERDIVADIVKALRSAGAGWVLKTHGGPFQASGIPDLICIAPDSGRLVGIEVKRPVVGRITELQKKQIELINKAGGVAGVAYGVDDALELLARGNGIVTGEVMRHEA